MSKIRIGIVGVGNCASSLIQGLNFYKRVTSSAELVPGLLHVVIGDYRVSDIVPVIGFDIDERKVGKDISEAIFAKPNVATKFSPVTHLNAPVYVGPILDGVSDHMAKFDINKTFMPTKKAPVDVVGKLTKHKVDVLINYLPVGSHKASEFYAQAAIDAGCSFINCIPTFIASDNGWVRRFVNASLPVLGDDIKSQLGATWIHRMAVQAFLDKGVKITFTSQENYGGNTDFLNMTDQDRIKSKLESKRVSIEHLVADHARGKYTIPTVYAGPGREENKHGFVDGQGDKKTAKILVEGLGFGGRSVKLELNLEVEDSPNSAGIVIDAIRCAKIALDRKISGAMTSASAFFFKHPYEKIPDAEAIKRIESFIAAQIER